MSEENTMARDDLLPCPFCGAAPEESERADRHTSTGRAHFIACMCGDYSATAHQFGETREEVAGKWNRRAELAVQPTEAQDHPSPADLFDLIRECEHLPEGQRGDAARAIIGCANRSYSAGVVDGKVLGALTPSTPATHADLLEAPPMPDALGAAKDGEFARFNESQIQARDAIWAERVRVALGMGAPAGWKLVPASLTPEMYEATWESKTCVAFDRMSDDYEAMLAAAPTIARPAASTVELSDERAAPDFGNEYTEGYMVGHAKGYEKARALLAKQAAQSPVVGRDAASLLKDPELLRIVQRMDEANHCDDFGKRARESFEELCEWIAAINSKEG